MEGAAPPKCQHWRLDLTSAFTALWENEKEYSRAGAAFSLTGS
jgi:hypothetical protein